MLPGAVVVVVATKPTLEEQVEAEATAGEQVALERTATARARKKLGDRLGVLADRQR